MSRVKGLLSISANWEPKTAEPFDARSRVGLKSDLIKSETWRIGNNSYTYKEMIVSVFNDTIENNGPYRLIGDDYTIESNWIKLVPSESRYYEQQFTESIEVIVTHNLGFYPNVKILDEDNTICVCKEQHLDRNTLKLSMNKPLTGIVICSG
jgi:hypothetical protein